jgi:TonB family protein
MKRLGLSLLVSFVCHGLVLLAVFSWFSSAGLDAPLAGGGGGKGVTIEILGGTGPSGQGGKEDERILPKDVQDGRMIAKIKPEQKAKAGRPGADDVPVGTPAPSGPGQGSAASGPGSGAGGTNTVLAEIRAKIERAKRYPLMARRMNMEGVSHVRFAIDASGQPQGLALKASSGSSVLDEEALSTIRRAAPFPVYGDALEIGIRFEIDESGP